MKYIYFFNNVIISCLVVFKKNWIARFAMELHLGQGLVGGCPSKECRQDARNVNP